MILSLKNGLVTVKEDTLENINEAMVYLDFQDLVLSHNHIVRLQLNQKDLYKAGVNRFRINPRSLTNIPAEIKVFVYSGINLIKEYTGLVNIETYISFGKRSHEKIPQVLLDLNAEIQKLENRIILLEKEKDLL